MRTQYSLQKNELKKIAWKFIAVIIALTAVTVMQLKDSAIKINTFNVLCLKILRFVYFISFM